MPKTRRDDTRQSVLSAYIFIRDLKLQNVPNFESLEPHSIDY